MSNITTSSTAEYFAKNLQQVGFSSPVKAVLTTLKEAVDNALDACEEAHIAPVIEVQVKKLGKSTDRGNVEIVEVIVEDNGPGLKPEDLPKVFGEYLASSKFGRGRCSRGQQGIGISAATTWAQLTNASGVEVISKTKSMPNAVQMKIDVDIKKNKGVIREKKIINWDKPRGLKTRFRIDGRVQLNGDGGLITYLEGIALVNPHLTLRYKLIDQEWRQIEKVSDDVPKIPPAAMPHPHTMKLGEFISHAHLFPQHTLESLLKKTFSKVTTNSIKDFVSNGLPKSLLKKTMKKFSEMEYKKAFQVLQKTEMANPSTKSVLTVGEKALSKSIQRMGEVDFFSVITRKAKICDHKPVVVETAIARLLNKLENTEESSIRLMRFANRVPLQFDKSACAITKAVESVNWRAYGLAQQKNNVPLGPYVFAVSVTSPFIKFKNASKETIDASEELVDEIRRSLQQTGQKLARHIKREKRADDLERKTQYIRQFVPILVKKLGDITKADKKRIERATKGIMKILGQDTAEAEQALQTAEQRLEVLNGSAKLKENNKQNGVLKEVLSEDEQVVETVAPKVEQDKKTTKKQMKEKKKKA